MSTEAAAAAQAGPFDPAGRTVLVTGGCGFIGSHFVRLLLEDIPDVRVVNADSLTYAGNPENLADVVETYEEDGRYRFRQVDIADADAVAACFDEVQPDAVVNFAAESHVDRSILDSGPFLRTNVIGTQTLLDAARRHAVDRYVQVSTDEVYGTLGDEGLFEESTPLAPNSPYSASKAAADMLVRSYVHTFGFPAVITRCSNNYGPNQFPEKLIPLFIANIAAGKPLPVYGDGGQVRDWIHVVDHCRGVLAALVRGTCGEVYNFGGASERTNLRLIHTLLELCGGDESLIQYVTDRPGHDRRYAIDFSKAAADLDWQPSVTLEDGLAETIDWYRTHADWTDNVQSGAYRRYYETQYGDRLQETTG